VHGDHATYGKRFNEYTAVKKSLEHESCVTIVADGPRERGLHRENSRPKSLTDADFVCHSKYSTLNNAQLTAIQIPFVIHEHEMVIVPTAHTKTERSLLYTVHTVARGNVNTLCLDVQGAS